MKFITKSAAQTQKLAAKILKQAIKKPRQGALILALMGELGAGKTTFVQGLGEALGIKGKILSPTYVVMKRFVISHKPFVNFYHFDFYRIDEPKKLAELEFDEIINEPKNLVAIEWPENIKNILPKDTIWIKFTYLEKDGRRIEFKI